MEPVYLPDLARLKRFASTYIDTLHGISTSFEHLLETSIKTEKNIIYEEEMRNNIASLLHLQPTNVSNLDNLTGLLANAVAHNLGKDDIRSVYEPKELSASSFWSRVLKLTIGLPRQPAKWPLYTFDKETIARYVMIKDAMVEHMKKHKNVLYKLQKEQKKQWEVTSKVKEYELCLQTAVSALSHATKDGYSGRGRARAIKNLEKTLRQKQKLLTKINTKYDKIQEEERAVRQSLDELQKSLITDVKSRMTKAFTEILGSIVKITSTGVNVTESERSLEILNAATRFNVKNTVESFSNICSIKLK